MSELYPGLLIQSSDMRAPRLRLFSNVPDFSSRWPLWEVSLSLRSFACTWRNSATRLVIVPKLFNCSTALIIMNC